MDEWYYEECRNMMELYPFLENLYNYDYSEEELRAIYFYSFIIDRYINLAYRNESLPEKMITSHKDTYRFLCSDLYTGRIKKDKLKDKLWNTSPCIKSTSNKINNILNSEESVFCPNYELDKGKPFYLLDNQDFMKQMKSFTKKISKILKNLSRNITKYFPRNDDIIVYRGMVLKSGENPKQIQGFTSTTYIKNIAINFAVNKYEPGLDCIVLKIIIPPNINIFTTDVFALSYEAELVITDKIKLKFDYNNEVTENFKNVNIRVIPCFIVR